MILCNKKIDFSFGANMIGFHRDSHINILSSSVTPAKTIKYETPSFITSVATGSQSGDPDDPLTHWLGPSNPDNDPDVNFLKTNLQDNIDIANYYEIL